MSTYSDEEIEALAHCLEQRTIQKAEPAPDATLKYRYVDSPDQDCRDAARALRQLLEERRWRPILEAPKDGTEILGFSNAGIEMIQWVDGEDDGPETMGHDAGWFGLSGYAFPSRSFGVERYKRPAEHQPTHWLPIPTPPQDGGD